MNQALVERNKRLGSTSEFNNSQDKHDIPKVMPMSDVSMFHLHSEYDTAGDQEHAIDRLMEQIEAGQERCVLMGVTGSGKTFAMANIIQRLGLPTLILSHNKTLARQLWQEMSELFPENAVEYFVENFNPIGNLLENMSMVPKTVRSFYLLIYEFERRLKCCY